MIRLEGEVGAGNAEELKEALLEALASHGQARISLETATGIDVTAVQLLWAAGQKAKSSGMVLALEGPVPQALRATLREAGFEQFPFSRTTELVDEGHARG